MSNLKLIRDLGIRALLAIIALVCYEIILVAILFMLGVKGRLDVQTAITLAGLGQSPAMIAMVFYFTKPTTPQQPHAEGNKAPDLTDSSTLLPTKPVEPVSGVEIPK